MNGLKVIHHRHFWQALGLLIVDTVFFTRTNAATITPFMLIIGFVLLMLLCYELVYDP